MEVNCRFYECETVFIGKIYCCEVNDDIFFGERGQKITKFVGEHLAGKSDDDVQRISFQDKKNLQFVPRGLTKTFKNIMALNFVNCSIKSITKKDLSGMPNLKLLWLHDNKLTSLPGNLFEETTKLEFVSLSTNKIVSIGAYLFDPLENLKYFELLNNITISKRFDSTGKHSSVTLNEFKQEIREKCTPKAVTSMNKRLITQFKGLFLLDSFKDCTISIGDNNFKAHRLVLAAKSPVLRKMLTENPDANELQLENVNADIFEILTGAMYGELKTDDFDDATILQELLHATNKLEIIELKMIVRETLLEKVDSDNAADLLILATKCNEKALKSKAFEEIKNYLNDKKIKDSAINDPEGLKELMEIRQMYEEKAEKFV